MAKIKIITDSGSDISKDFAKEYNVSVLPLSIIIDGKSYLDGVDIGRREYVEKIRTLDEIPTTSMVSAELMKKEFMKNLDEYDHQIYVTISSASSGTYNTACMIKNEIEEEINKPSNITVIDSYSFTMVYGIIVTEIAKMAKDGAEYDEIIDAYKKLQSEYTAYFIVDDLKHLKKGGRINPAVAVVGTMLGIKPILTIKDGLVDAVAKERGKNRALCKIVELMASEIKDPENQIVIVPNGGADEDAEILKTIANEKIKVKGFWQYDLGSTIVTHSGAGIVGLIFRK